MNDRGLASTTRRPDRRPSTTSAPLLWPLNLPPTRAASSSATRKPMLCRLPAYWGPGLPSPTTRTTSLPSTRAQLLLQLVQQGVHGGHPVAPTQPGGAGESGVEHLGRGHRAPAVQGGGGPPDERVDLTGIVAVRGLRQPHGQQHGPGPQPRRRDPAGAQLPPHPLQESIHVAGAVAVLARGED